MRIGLIEMKHFCQEFFDDVKEETFLQESAGVADLITSCEQRASIWRAELTFRPRRQEQEGRGGICAAEEGAWERFCSQLRGVAVGRRRMAANTSLSTSLSRRC